METNTNQSLHDPTKPVIPPSHTRIKWSWVLFVAFNISIPILFLITYYWMQNQ